MCSEFHQGTKEGTRGLGDMPSYQNSRGMMKKKGKNITCGESALLISASDGLLGVHGMYYAARLIAKFSNLLISFTISEFLYYCSYPIIYPDIEDLCHHFPIIGTHGARRLNGQNDATASLGMA